MMKLRLFGFAVLVCACVIVGYSALVSGQGITQVRVTASTPRYTGPCPAHIRFTARIFVDKYPMVLNYEWERSDGARAGRHEIRVPNRSTRTISVVENWQLGKRGERMEVWEKIRVRSGNADFTSDPAIVTITCR